MCEVQLNTIESHVASATRRIGEQTGQAQRQIADVLQMSVSNSFASAEFQRVELPLVQYLRSFFGRQRNQPGAHFRIGCCKIPECLAMPRRDRQELPKVTRRHRPSPDRQKINQLNEQSRVATTGFTYHANEVPEPRKKSVVARAEQGAAGHISDARGLDDNGPRLPTRKALVPFENFGSDKPVLARPPWHHGGN